MRIVAGLVIMLAALYFAFQCFDASKLDPVYFGFGVILLFVSLLGMRIVAVK